MGMITAIFKSAVIKAGRRVITAFGYAASTAKECAPFGDDAQPLKDMLAVYADTGVDGEQVVIGYINRNQLAGPGEKRAYSLKADGSVAFYTWLKSNGTLELGGNAYHLVRYEQLQQALAQHNTAINTELTKIQTAITSLGGSYVALPLALNITTSKINEIKCI